MPYQMTTVRVLLKESVEKAMTTLDMARNEALNIADTGDRAELLAEVGQGYALLAQAAAEAMDETA